MSPKRKPPTFATPAQLGVLWLEAKHAAHAIAMQAARAVTPSEHDALFDNSSVRTGVDFRFLTVAVRWLDDIAETINNTLKSETLDQAIQEFRDALPEARSMRSIGEHLPEYILGDGGLQKKDAPDQRGQQNLLGIMIWTGRDDRGTHLTWAGTDIDATQAQLAADRLYAAVSDAVTPCLTRTHST